MINGTPIHLPRNVEALAELLASFPDVLLVEPGSHALDELGADRPPVLVVFRERAEEILAFWPGDELAWQWCTAHLSVSSDPANPGRWLPVMRGVVSTVDELGRILRAGSAELDVT